MTKEIAETIINNHDSDKILFGSDVPWCKSSDVRDFILSLDISNDIKSNIFHKNAQKLLEVNFSASPT